ERLIDELQRRAHAHRRAVGLEHLAIAREDGHAWANGRLRQVDGRDVAVLKPLQRTGQLALEGVQELTACRERCASGTRAANEDDGGSQRTYVLLKRTYELTAYRPRTCYHETRPKQALQHGLPTSGGHDRST